MKLFLLLLFFGTALSAPVIPADFNLFDDNVDVNVDDGNIVLTNKETGSVRTVDQKGVISGDEEVNVDDTQDDYDAVDGKQEDFPAEDTQEDESDASDIQGDPHREELNPDDTQDDSEDAKNEKELDVDLIQDDDDDDDDDTEFQSSGSRAKPPTKWRPRTTKRTGITRSTKRTTTTRLTPPTPRTTTTKTRKPPAGGTTHHTNGGATPPPNKGGSASIPSGTQPNKQKKISCSHAVNELEANGIDNVLPEISAKFSRCSSVNRGYIKFLIMFKRKAGEEGEALLEEMISKFGEKAREMITEYVLNTPAETPDPQYDPKAPDADDREDPEEAEDPPGEPEEPEEPTEEPGDNDANGETEE